MTLGQHNQIHGRLPIRVQIRDINPMYKLARNYRDFMSRINYILRYSTAKLFAAKFRLSSIAKVFAIAGKDLSRPLNPSQMKNKKDVIGQTEEKIYESFTSIGISSDKLNDKKKKSGSRRVGATHPFTKYSEKPAPETLGKKISTKPLWKP